MNSPARNIKLTLAYDGTNYVGWQVQPNGVSVQSVVTNALEKLTGDKINLLSAGRTDSGVHALGQVASFQTTSPITADGVRKALRRFLPDDIVCHHAEEVSLDFHATFSAIEKRYRYVIHNTRTQNPFLRNYVWHFHSTLDAQAMHTAGQKLLGKHDFRSFESHWPNKATSVRTVKEVTVRRQAYCPLDFRHASVGCDPKEDGQSGDFLWLEIVADGFLYNMVRAIVGTLVPVGRGRWSAEDVWQILTDQDRAKAGDTAPACGLYLVQVAYPENIERPHPPA